MEFQVVLVRQRTAELFVLNLIAFCCSRCHCRLNLLHLSIKIRFFYRDVVIGHKYMLKYSDHCSSHNPTNMTANLLHIVKGLNPGVISKG